MNRDVERRRAELEEACRRNHVRRLELFGSGAAGADLPRESDLDFLVEFEELPVGVYADSYFRLLETLEALFERSVDLVVARAISNPYFRQSVEETKVPLYAA